MGDALKEFCGRSAVTVIGRVSGQRLTIGEWINASLDDVNTAWRAALQRYLAN